MKTKTVPEYEIGDIVQLKGHKQIMIVNAIKEYRYAHENTVSCVWQSSIGEPFQEEYNPICLMPAIIVTEIHMEKTK